VVGQMEWSGLEGTVLGKEGGLLADLTERTCWYLTLLVSHHISSHPTRASLSRDDDDDGSAQRIPVLVSLCYWLFALLWVCRCSDECHDGYSCISSPTRGNE
jgi:hypothetical protein